MDVTSHFNMCEAASCDICEEYALNLDAIEYYE